MTDERKPIKISLVIAGAVSLGAYEGGALAELLYTLEYLNGMDENGNPRNPDTRYVIDVITGGSAGSLTGAMVARILLHNTNRRDILKKTWVDKVDFKTLKDTEKKCPGALFKTADAQDRLMDIYLQGKPPVHPDDKGEDFPLEVVQRASCAPDEGESLHLAFSVTNLAGVDYQIPYRNTGLAEGAPKGQTQTYFSFFEEFELDAEHLTDQSYWAQISDSAIASGSFPLAFTPKILKKKLGDYPNADATINPYLGPQPRGVEHFDGGMLRNEPLKKAMELSRLADGNLINDDRIFILIDPKINKSKQEPGFSHMRSQTPDIISNAMRCVGAIYSEASNEDWKQINKVNQQLKWMQEIANDYVRLTNGLPDEALDAAFDEADAKAKSILADKEKVVSETHPPHLTGEYYTKSKAHVRELFSTAFDRLAANRNPDGILKAAEYLEAKLFCLMAASDLNRKTEITLWIIGADDENVGGDPLFAMLGFFNRTIREFDYRVGRSNTRDILMTEIFKNVLPADFPKEGDDIYPNGQNPNYDTKELGDQSGVTPDIIPLRDRWVLKKIVADELNHARKIRKKNESWSISGALVFTATRIIEGLLLWEGTKKGAAWTWGKIKNGGSWLWGRINVFD